MHDICLRKSGSDLKVSEISKPDQDVLNSLISKLHPKIPTIQDQTILKLNNCIFFDDIGEMTHSPILKGKRWMIKIGIFGYNLYKNERFSPIWRVTSAIDSQCRNSDAINRFY